MREGGALSLNSAPLAQEAFRGQLEGKTVGVAPGFRRLCAYASLCGFAGAAPALGQQPSSTPAPAAAQSGAADAQASVTVVAPASGDRSLIDRRSYSLAGAAETGSSSVSDALRQVPSVQVDIDGNVSLRGDSNVTILVDGKPSALFSGDGRTQALQSMSADQFARVEVLSNPPAGMTAEGGGGVINLITKPAPKGGAAPKASGTLKATVGSGDRFDLGASAAYTGHGLSANAGADFRRSGFLRDIGSRYALPDASTGVFAPAEGVQVQTERDDFLTLYADVGYDLDPQDRLAASVNFEAGRTSRKQDSAYVSLASDGSPALAYTAPGVYDVSYSSLAESLGLTRTLPGQDCSLSATVSFSQNDFFVQNGASYLYAAPVQPGVYQNLSETSSTPELDFKLDLKTAPPGGGRLALGYEGKFDWRTLDNQGLEGLSPALAAVDPADAQIFKISQTVNAIYASFQQSWGKLTAQPGLRLEVTSLDTDLAAAALKGRQNYFEAYPSLHLDYALNDASAIKLSYGRRVQRPDGSQLDPFRVEASATLYSAGNPGLRPAFTTAYELGYEYRRKTSDLQATLFYRDKTDLLTTVTQDIGQDVLLSTWENLGHAHDLGLEFVAKADLSPALSANASMDLAQSRSSAANLGLAGSRSAFVASGKASFNWKAGRKDFVQLGVDASGRELTAQGYRGGAIFSDLGWRHQFDSRFAFVLSADNPFGLARRTVAIDTPTLIETDKRKFNTVAVFLGFTYAFGAPPKRSDGFDFKTSRPGAQ